MNDRIDDRQLEEYLRSFQPLPPAPLSIPERRWSFVALSPLAAGIIIALVLLFQLRRIAPVRVEPEPITIGSANKLLTRSSSWNSLIDDPGFAFRSWANVTTRRGGALEFLGQEDFSK
jgi:hypothetical protein